jgi:hypothetical protein
MHRYIFILSLIIFAACKKDEGNYTYHPVDTPLVDSGTLASSYNVQQYDSLVVTPNIAYHGDTANLSYQWLVYVKSLSSVTIGPPITLSATRDVRQIINVAPGTYYLELIITDKSNNLKTTTRTLLNILASIETGWLVLHETNATSDVDFIASKNLSPTGPEKRLSNLFLSTTGAAMPGSPRFIGFARRSNSAFNWITVATDKGIRRMNGFTFARLAADNQLFRRPLTATDYQGYFSSGSTETIINGGNLQSIQWGLVQDAYFNGPYEGTFSLASSILYVDYPVYNIFAYDQQNSHFLRSNAYNATHAFTNFTSSPAAAFDPANVGKDLLFMDLGYLHNIFAFFKDKTGNGRWLYALNATKVDDGNVAMATYDMSALPEITNAQFFQVGDLANVALYATDKTVYRFDYSGTRNATVAFNGLPGNETITCLRIFKPRVNGNAPTPEFITTNNAVVYIATWDGTQGKLYEMSMNIASGVINPTPLKIYTGFGKIKDMTSKFRGTGT